MTTREALDRTILLCRDFVRPAEASDAEIVDELTSISVSIVADAANLQTAAAQSAVVALAGQILGYGGRLRLIVPDVPVVGYQPPLLADRLRRGLVELAEDSIPGGRAEVAIEPSQDDFVFVVGSTPWTGSQSIRAWRLGGTRWSGTIAPPDVVVPVWPDEFPLGALIAATAAAAEPFKHVLAGMLARVGVATRHQELRAARAATVRLGEDDLSIGPMILGDVDVVSGGAITNAFLHALLRFPGIAGRVRIFEPEVIELTNLNRYLLARRHQLGMKKVHALTKWQTPSLTIDGVPVRFDQDAVAAAQPLARTMVVGADDIPTRWFVQRQNPEWLGVGATAHYLAVVSEHAKGESCVGCLHPEDDDVVAPIATVSFVSYWAGLALAARLARMLAGGRLAGRRQTLELSALRLDSDRAVWWHPVQKSRRCPVQCSEAQGAAA